MKSDKSPALCQIQASAGSGKTWELTRRYLERLVACGRDFGHGSGACISSVENNPGWNDIIAATFTNAAATEMRERVIKRLKEVALGAHDEGVPFSQAEAACWVNAILRNMSALNIRTIDSLLHLIVRSSAIDLGIAPDFEPVFATDEVFAPYYDLILDHASREDGAMRELLASVCRALITEESKGFVVGNKLHKPLKNIIDDVLCGQMNGLSPIEKIKRKLELSQSTVLSAARKFIAVAKKSDINWNKTSLRIVSEIAEGDFNKCKLKTALESDAQKFFTKGTIIPHALELAHMHFVAAAQHCNKQREYLRPALKHAPFVRLAQTLVEAFFLNKERESAIPSILIPRLAIDALTGEHGVSQALCRLGANLTHFLVDEFQDTNQEQWQSLRPLVADALARGGSLTWVGDVKQSIYGWRGADPTLFNAILKDTELMRVVPEESKNDSYTLPCNRRSRRIIIDHNNSVFAPLGNADFARHILQMLWPAMPEDHMDRGVKHLSGVFANARQDCLADADNCGGYVHMERIEGDKADELDEAVLNRLCDLLQKEVLPRRRLSDVLVLVRSNDKASLVAETLVRKGIPVITENSLLLAEHQLIAQLTAFLDFLNNPENDVAFWTMLTGSLVLGHSLTQGLTQEELHNWCVNKRSGPLFQNFRNTWPQIWQQLFEPFHSLSGILTPYDAAREWLLHLDAETRFPQERTFLRRFLEVLQNAEEKGLSSLGAFIDHWRSSGGEEKVPMPNSMNAVRVMTIHKAKGLEAPCVIVPWTSFIVKPSKKHEILEHEGLRIAVPMHKIRKDSYYQNLVAQTCEELNLLYVSFTRAKDELYIFRTGTQAIDKCASLGKVLDSLWAKADLSSSFPLGNPMTTLTEIQSKETGLEEIIASSTDNEEFAISSSTRVYGNTIAEKAPENWRPMQWLPELKISKSEQNDNNSMKGTQRGILLHLCLERLRITGNAEQDAQNALASVDASILDPFAPEEQNDLLEAIAWFAGLPCASHWLAKGRREQSLMAANGEILRVDLLVREPWGTLIIDYKSGTPEKDHISQLRSYIKNLSTLSESGETCGLLVYLDKQRFRIMTADTNPVPLNDCEILLHPAKALAFIKQLRGDSG